MTVIILHQVFEVVPNGNLDLTLAKEVSCSSGEECQEGTGEITFHGELSGTPPIVGHIKDM